jgi:exodeoxyribonuclease-3
MRLRLCTWNVNSVRLRIDHIARFVAEQAPDVLCLQEIKCQAEEFPTEAFAQMGLPHVKIAGQKGWHGVAIASRLPIEPGPQLDLCREGHARCLSGVIGGVEVQNFYIPAGGDAPDRALNPKYDHKLDFFERLTRAMAARDPAAPLAIVGDLNVAPGEFDVWSHKQMLRTVSHTPPEIEAIPDPQKLFSWWSYRAADFRISNRGLRLDHIWLSPGLGAPTLRQGPASAKVHDSVREWERPSDHAPVTADVMV